MRITTKAIIQFTPAKVLKPIEAEAPKRALRCAVLVQGDAIRSMKRGGGSRHVPSPVGTPPHAQTPALRPSIHSAIHGKGAVVGPTEKYGWVHEFAWRHFPSRPFMRPALRRMINRFPKQFEGMI